MSGETVLIPIIVKRKLYFDCRDAEACRAVMQLSDSSDRRVLSEQ
jgi:hypothetical protein